MSEDAKRLYLATPPLGEGAPFPAALSEALAAGDVASLLIRFARDDRTRQ